MTINHYMTKMTPISFTIESALLWVSVLPLTTVLNFHFLHFNTRVTLRLIYRLWAGERLGGPILVLSDTIISTAASTGLVFHLYSCELLAIYSCTVWLRNNFYRLHLRLAVKVFTSHTRRHKCFLGRMYPLSSLNKLSLLKLHYELSWGTDEVSQR